MDFPEDYADYIQAVDTRLAGSQDRTLAKTGQSTFRVKSVTTEEALRYSWSPVTLEQVDKITDAKHWTLIDNKRYLDDYLKKS